LTKPIGRPAAKLGKAVLAYPRPFSDHHPVTGHPAAVDPKHLKQKAIELGITGCAPRRDQITNHLEEGDNSGRP
jgi:hypothetical protein